MKGVSSAPGDYIHFKSQVPLHKISIGLKQWRYYDFGPKVVPPLICLPGTAGTADVYYKQIMSLSMKGYRVVSVDIPRVWNHHEWIQAFEKFLDAIDVHHVHLYGTSLGGFLAQLFAQHRPRRVRSLILSNSFLETRSFSAAMPWAPIVSWTPSFLLKRYVLTGIRDGPHEPFIADSVDFVVSQVETLSREDLASRLTLTFDSASVGALLLSDSCITIMDTNDYCAIPQQLKDQLSEKYPGARQACLKTGGDFPFLSRPDEVNLHLQLHLRRVGVEARPDLVRGISKDGSGGSPSENNDGRDDPEDPTKDDNARDGSGESTSEKNDGRDDPEDPTKDDNARDGSGESTSEKNDGRDDPEDPTKDDNARDGSGESTSEKNDGRDDPEDPTKDDNVSDGSGESTSEKNDGREDADNPSKDDGGGSASPTTNDHLPPTSYNSDSNNLDEVFLGCAKTFLLNSGYPAPLLVASAVVEPQHIVDIDIVRLTQTFSVLYMLPCVLGALSTTTWKHCWKFRQFV